MSGDHPVYLDEASVLKYLSWDILIPAIEGVLSDLSKKEETKTIQPARLIMPIPSRQGAVLCMPSFSGKQNILGCKVVSSFQMNKDRGLPSIFGTILLLDSETGRVKMVMEGGEITAWRTAAASVVATKHLHTGTKSVLAILGAGVQGKSHALAMHHFFKFPEVRIWNRTYEKAEKLCSELGPWAKPYKNREMCVRDVDVIVTATYSSEPIIKAAWLRPGTHINAVGFGIKHHNEISLDIYENATIIVDNMAGALRELQGLTSNGIPLFCELGQIIVGSLSFSREKPFTIFHSMGMSLEDVITAEIVYKQFLENRTKQHNTC